jgi:molybdenum-dependent DNA-binding transcriptional regulator ModE
VKPAARELGISYEHLLMCIKGIRQSRSLMERFRTLTARQAKAAKRNNGTKDQYQ